MSKWTEFVSKHFREQRKQNKDYQFSDALKDASKIYKKQGGDDNTVADKVHDSFFEGLNNPFNKKDSAPAPTTTNTTTNTATDTTPATTPTTTATPATPAPAQGGKSKKSKRRHSTKKKGGKGKTHRRRSSSLRSRK
jgi:hypothetical protein